MILRSHRSKIFWKCLLGHELMNDDLRLNVFLRYLKVMVFGHLNDK
jgi:hypothetical protein